MFSLLTEDDDERFSVDSNDAVDQPLGDATCDEDDEVPEPRIGALPRRFSHGRTKVKPIPLESSLFIFKPNNRCAVFKQVLPAGNLHLHECYA